MWMFGLAGSLAASSATRAGWPPSWALVEDPERLPWGTRAHYLRLRGFDVRDSEPDQVEPLLREAAECFERWGSPLWRARTMADLGVWLDRQGLEEEAGTALGAPGRRTRSSGRTACSPSSTTGSRCATEPCGRVAAGRECH